MTAYYEDLEALKQARAKIKAYGLEVQPGFWLISDEDLFDMVGRGACGPGKGIWEKLVPDTICGVDIHPACIIHDYDYVTGKTGHDKEAADLRFWRNMNILIDADIPKGTRGNAIASDMAQVYYNAVWAFGKDSFYEGKA